MESEVLKLFDLLERKNSYLLEFHKINNEEIRRLINGSSENFENFYFSRELLLNAIERLDKQFIDIKEKKSQYRVQSTHRKKLKEILNLKRSMVQSILDQDVVIFSLMEKLDPEKAIA